MKTLFKIIGTLLVIWGIFSTIEVNLKNVHPNPQYSSINMWSILVEVAENAE